MKIKRILKAVGILLLTAVLIVGAVFLLDHMPPRYDSATDAQKKVLNYAKAHGLSWNDYPESLIALLERNPETEQFVLEYPTASQQTFTTDLSEYESCETVPLFLQWDQRWGYIRYGSDVAGLTGCGPMCLAMCCFYLTGDDAYSPANMLRFASDHGYYVPGSGSSWTLVSQGGVKLGFTVTELPLDENRIRNALMAGTPIICAVGPGDFTTTGHYIVLTDWEDGQLRVNDPNSRGNSEKLWTYEQIQGQIRNLWSIGI